MRQIIYFAMYTASLLLLTSCYRIDVQQGNVITQESLNRIHKGMTSTQVVKILGTPVLNNVYSDNRMIYVYTFKPGVGKGVKKRLIIYFSNKRIINYIYTDSNKIPLTPFSTKSQQVSKKSEKNT